MGRKIERAARTFQGRLPSQIAQVELPAIPASQSIASFGKCLEGMSSAGPS
jgi:hypothetical protein